MSGGAHLPRDGMYTDVIKTQTEIFLITLPVPTMLNNLFTGGFTPRTTPQGEMYDGGLSANIIYRTLEFILPLQTTGLEYSLKFNDKLPSHVCLFLNFSITLHMITTSLVLVSDASSRKTNFLRTASLNGLFVSLYSLCIVVGTFLIVYV